MRNARQDKFKLVGVKGPHCNSIQFKLKVVESDIYDKGMIEWVHVSGVDTNFKQLCSEIRRLVKLDKDKKELSLFTTKFGEKLADVGFDARFIEEYTELKMKKRGLEQEVFRLTKGMESLYEASEQVQKENDQLKERNRNLNESIVDLSNRLRHYGGQVE